MSSVINQVERIYKHEGVIGIIKSIPNFKKIVDKHRSRLLIPIENTIWGTYMIFPENVRNCSLPSDYLPPRGKEAIHGIYDGTWDVYAEPLEETTFYQSMHARFVREVPWEETRYYQIAVKDLERKADSVWNGCETQAEMRERAEKIDAMYQDISEQGYQFEKESEKRYIVGDFEVGDRLLAGIDRHGNVIRLANGRHRLAIAKLLDIPIPVTITLCHAKYVDQKCDFRLT